MTRVRTQLPSGGATPRTPRGLPDRGASVSGTLPSGGTVRSSRGAPPAPEATRTGRHYQAIVDVHLLLMRGGRVLLGRRANTGYGDGAYEPPSSRLAERETIIEAAIRVAAAQAGIALTPPHVSLAHVMHDVSGAGRIAFFLTADGWDGEPGGPVASYSDLAWYDLDDLPANMIDRARVAVRNYAAGVGFSTYPSFTG